MTSNRLVFDTTLGMYFYFYFLSFHTYCTFINNNIHVHALKMVKKIHKTMELYTL